MVVAPFSMMRRPVAVEPVNEMRSTRGSSTSSSPTRWSDDEITLNTPARDVGVLGDEPADAGARSTACPARASGSWCCPVASAWPTFWSVTSSGKFQGTIAPTTPAGSFTTVALALPPNACPSGSLRSHSNSSILRRRPEEAVLERSVELRAVGEDDRGADLGDELGAVAPPARTRSRPAAARGSACGTRGSSPSRSRRRRGAPRRWRRACRRPTRRRSGPAPLRWPG